MNMNDRIIEFISNLDTDSFETYLANAKIDRSYNLAINQKEYDYSWLNQFEQYLPFLTNILSMDFSKADPSVIESYENRFIRTLVYRISDYIKVQRDLFNRMQEQNKKRNLETTITTKVGNEDIIVNLSISATKSDESHKGEAFGLSLKDRLERVSAIVEALKRSSLMKALENTSFISSPINKTALFEEETNYRKALEFYNFIENTSDGNDDYATIDIKDLDDKLLITTFMEYQLLNEVYKDKKNNSYQDFLNRLIERLVLTSSIDEKSFKKMLAKKFEDEYNKKKNREQTIQNIFLKTIDDYNKQVKDALRALKG